ncbi:ROK family protein [uncultured Fusobacterium sp.]|jgi:fructokinase|uniref:ROK family protein n=1 Tax=uncultured Fusobacterium sp. TaxID=159267 RepID=UPI002590EC2A|nr:ROK family protein [uncultured Fusobacterium sp.]
MKFGAIDASGNRFLCGITTENGDTIDKAVFLTETPEKTIPKVIEYFKGKAISALGLGCFGPIDLNPNSKTYGYIKATPKKGWQNFDIVGSLKKALNIPIYFDSHTNLAALGETIWGAAKDSKNTIYLTIGNGIGGGAIIENKLVHGMMHPEMGHMFINRHPRDKFIGTCHFHGGNCLEGMASIPAIERRWHKSLSSLEEDHLAWDLQSYYIGHAIVNYILVLAPEKIILGGLVMKYGNLFPKIRKEVQKLLNGYIKTEQIKNIDTYIVPPDLGEQSGFFGAVALCIRNYK